MVNQRSWATWFLFLLAAGLLLGLFLTPHNPMAQSFLSERLSGPTWSHPMGVDGLGRDFLSRVWRGGAHTLLMGAGAMAGAAFGAIVLLIVERMGPAFIRRSVRKVVGVWIAIPVLFVGLL